MPFPFLFIVIERGGFMKRMIQLLMIVDVLLFVGGFFFDYYTTSLGLNDRFYGTFVTNHLF
ncbi:hypothetical protein OMQ_01467 [Enterococcus saccharolyticus subsp. saccharolyticus ATCC 43076]|uniref:Uncharacterized protein n=1 Tax=Enterococcus saccharolyticus subsp. saccharolyticus ATCC 43076 TaxID=1139996 RepID=S0JKB0_9ENTE|nr:hypothetical protein OMQ_01467 [Enterococcus saccharolyticus subsp. saccharolyticus ATCC 43076]EOT81311.1 hypothetical protein I572_01846 [Enterococcus saccharolyticus subsp. saccharolyticus ATCC 43076]OJG90313.1 hypothetical protein RV16_GL001714 [Enterococcus saccharolyticus]